MKTFYILFILLLSFSYANAQDQVETKKVDTTVITSQDTAEVSLNIEASNAESNNKEEVPTKATLVRATSDIKIYLNQVRNVENIDLLFPKINKTVKA